LNELVARTYDRRRFFGPIGRYVDKQEKKIVKELVLSVEEAATVLDIPCGTGRFFEVLRATGRMLVGADVSKSMLSVAGQRFSSYLEQERPSLVVCVIEHLPFRDEVFRCVTSVRLHGHLPPAAKKLAIDEMNRVSNGFIVLSFYNLLSVMGILDKVTSIISNRPNESFPETPSSIKRNFWARGAKVKSFRAILPFISVTSFVLAEKTRRPVDADPKSVLGTSMRDPKTTEQITAKLK